MKKKLVNFIFKKLNKSKFPIESLVVDPDGTILVQFPKGKKYELKITKTDKDI